MSGPLAAIHLLAPGLFGPVPGLELSSAIPSVPRLETLLARADSLNWPGGDLETTIFSFSALERDPQGDYPAAALRRAGDGTGLDQDYWLQANPVHLRADRDRVVKEVLAGPGDSLAVDSKYFFSFGDHLAPGGNAFVYEYDAETNKLRRLVDIRKLLRLPDGHYTPGKIHGRLDLGDDGWRYTLVKDAFAVPG